MLELITWVHLGCSTQEKHHAQPVKINIKLLLSTPPPATITDNINDTVCYAEIVRLVQKLSQENHFNLIEYLAAQIYDIIYQNFIESKLEKIFLNVTVTKLKSSVSGVHGGVSFSYSGKDIQSLIWKRARNQQDEERSV
ncbi:dihydroneopterin aldolase [Rickettsia tillamookensis]|uniref:dihydroneopterin aldolase n=1 Tax=Rickettsia tillamookensis TaxID=2761623 RepID=UPI001923C450